ncbi:IS5 family transposase [Gluconacetobacter asukensis]|uniref:IS5 family transposase n=1 Tax=Gluconacetobacter asukensis TaxID=1017181 RepID=A0A7W4J3Z2_9PROT|nr:IS5 family transposase [Gluconacetobacter asukensis]MBB2174295.1 IS5 family transposase [Gluconacetobacter asukensis]
MSRRTLTDEQWSRIEGHLPGRLGTPGRGGVDNRLFVDAILWMAGNAARWRDLPDVFGKWTAVHARFRRWSHSGVWERLFHTLADTPDFEYVLIDSTISKVHADATGGKRGAEAAAIGRSRGGLTTKLHAVVDAIGLPLRIHPTPGQYGDRPQAETLLSGLQGVGHVIADAAYDADPLRAFIADDLGATAQIKANPSRAIMPPINWNLYKERHQVECFFNKLKRFRRIALRCEKTLPAFMGFVHLACAMIWLR